jgi:hypothetical protein
MPKDCNIKIAKELGRGSYAGVFQYKNKCILKIERIDLTYGDTSVEIDCIKELYEKFHTSVS